MTDTQSTTTVVAFPKINAAKFSDLANAEIQLSAGDYMCVVQGPMRIFVGKNAEKNNVGQVYYSFKFVPLRDPSNGNSGVSALAFDHVLTSPFQSEGQTSTPPGRAAEDLVRFMSAMYGTPDYPRRGEGLAKGEYIFKGGTVSGPEEVKAAKAEALAAAAAKLEEIHNAPGSVAGEGVNVRRNAGKSGGIFNNFYSELPADWGYSEPKAA